MYTSEIGSSGPLAAQAARLRPWLVEQGYAESTQVCCGRVYAGLDRWLQAGRVPAASVTEQQLERFAAEHRASGGRLPGLVPVVRYLRAVGVVRPGRDLGVVDRAVEEFGRYLVEQRQLAPLTVAQRGEVARRFLSGLEQHGTLALDGLGPVQVHGFVMAEAARLRRGSITAVLHAVRSFLRYLFATGVTGTDLSGCLPAVTARPYAELPRSVDRATVAALLGSCDRSTAVGRRDFAILMLMVRLGLRAVEVASLRLDDIDWRGGQLLVHAKGGRQERLPLPVDVGRALVAYLRDGRPVTTSRAVFMRAVAPVGPLSRNGVVFVPRDASKRAGVPVVGAHRLRHTAATAMLQSGASLRAVGQVLGHHRDQTTAIYAAVHPSTLEQVMRPWPEPVR